MACRTADAQALGEGWGVPRLAITVCSWAGPAFVVILVLSFLMMGFLPPPSPLLSAEGLAELIDERRTAFRLGATLVMQTTLFMFLLVAAVATQLRRIEAGREPLYTYASLILGLVGNVLPLFMGVIWTTIAYRPERDPQLLLLLNDFAFLALVMPAFPLMLQWIVIGAAILSDTRKTPLYPRWAAYLNFWAALLLLPGVVATFFKTGPFAWDGVLVFWVEIFAFFLWIFVMAWLTPKAAAIPDEA